MRTELGSELRKFFVAKDGHTLLDADYSQIELRILAHISGDKVMSDAFINGDDIHARTASQVMKLPMEMITPQLRSRAKAVNFGIVESGGGNAMLTTSGDTTIEQISAAETIDVNAGDYDLTITEASSGNDTELVGGAVSIENADAGNDLNIAASENLYVHTASSGNDADVTSGGLTEIGTITVEDEINLVSRGDILSALTPEELQTSSGNIIAKRASVKRAKTL